MTPTFGLVPGTICTTVTRTPSSNSFVKFLSIEFTFHAMKTLHCSEASPREASRPAAIR